MNHSYGSQPHCGTKRLSWGIMVVLAMLALWSAQASAADFHIDWLDMSTNWMTGSPVPVTLVPPGSVPSGSVFKLFGYGDVRITYDFQFGSTSDRIRSQFQAVQNKTMVSVSGPHTYSWNAFDALTRFNPDLPGTVPSSYWVKYEFLSGFPVPKGELVLGVLGLGSEPAYISTITVNNHGTFLGDYDIPYNSSTNVDYGPTLFTPGKPFVLQNSVNPNIPKTGNPWFNTDLAVVSIDDYPVSELTLTIYHIGFDGFQFTVGRRHALEPDPDAWIQDRDPCDNGSEPDLCSEPMWESDDIRVRNTKVTGPVPGDPWQSNLPHQNPIDGVENYVYVKVRNRGNASVTGTLHLYWTQASMVCKWSDANKAPSSGEEIGYGNLVTVGPYSPFLTEYVAEFKWTPLVAPWDFCLLARFDSPLGDPMCVLEADKSLLTLNAHNNNNIALKNVFPVVSLVPAEIIVGNPQVLPADANIRFNAAGGGGGIPFLDRGSVRVVLAPEMFANWMGAGGQGQDIVVNPDSSISLTSTLSEIQGIPMGPDESHPMMIYFTPNSGGPTPTFQHFVVSQFSDGQTTPDGGVTFEFRYGSENIPTLTEWGMIIMFVVLAGGIIWFIMRQRRRVATA